MTDFLKNYGNKEMEDILSCRDLQKSLEEFSKQFHTLDADKKSESTQFLNRIYGALNAHIASFSDDLKEQASQVNKVQQNAQACIAYLKTADNRRARKG